MTFDFGLFTAINDLAVATPWLHMAALIYAEDGVVLFAALMLAGWWVARAKTGLAADLTADLTLMARALWAPLGMLIALGLN